MPSSKLVYCIFPNLPALVGLTSEGPKTCELKFFDSVLTLWAQPEIVSALKAFDGKPRRLFMDVVELGFGEFLDKIGLPEGVTPSDWFRASMLRYFVLARSEVVLYHVDSNVQAPEIMLANMADIPIVGVSERYSMEPVLRSLLHVILNPHVHTIIGVLEALVSLRSDRVDDK